jgi:hypothetical protein
MLANFSLLERQPRQVSQPVCHDHRRCHHQHSHGLDYPGAALAFDLVVAVAAEEEDARWKHVGCWRPSDGFQYLTPAPYRDQWPVAGCDDCFRASRLIWVIFKDQPSRSLLLSDHSNAEAGIALICTCLPAAVGQFKFLRDRLGYSSAQLTNELLDNQFSTTNSAVASSAAHRNAVRKYYHSRPEASFDEMELVANAQGNSTSDQDTVRFSGIMRKVEVRSAASYTSKDSDGESKETHESRQQIAH